VTAGTFLGVSAPAGADCPRGTIKAPGGACVACAPGSFQSRGSCKPCDGGRYSPAGLWGATACLPCKAPQAGGGGQTSCG
jgi:hypothetical protein